MTIRHQFVWNTASFSDCTDENAFNLFEDVLKGLVHIPGKDETAVLYCVETTPLLQRNISKRLTVADFIGHLEDVGEQDLALILTEIDDKADAINTLPDDQFNELAKSSYYFDAIGYTISIDYLALAADLDAILFTAASADHWRNSEIAVGHVSDFEIGGETGLILSVCDITTAIRITELLRPSSENLSLEELIPNCVIDEELSEWFDELQEENKRITRNKLVLAHGREFKGGEPLFKTLHNADGMREVRFKAFPGGAGRVLFGSLENGKIALLRGFIKKSDNEGYAENIPSAAITWETLRAVNKRVIGN